MKDRIDIRKAAPEKVNMADSLPPKPFRFDSFDQQRWLIEYLQKQHAAEPQRDRIFMATAAAMKKYDEKLYTDRILNSFANYRDMELWEKGRQILESGKNDEVNEEFSSLHGKIEFLEALQVIDPVQFKSLRASPNIHADWKNPVEKILEELLRSQRQEYFDIVNTLDDAVFFGDEGAVARVNAVLTTDTLMRTLWKEELIEGLRAATKQIDNKSYQQIHILMLLKRHLPDFFENEIKSTKEWGTFVRELHLADSEHLKGDPYVVFKALADIKELLSGPMLVKPEASESLPLTRSY